MSTLKIVMAAAEAYPYAKVGGLADVVGGLCGALAELGHEVTLILPRYRQVDPDRYSLERHLVPGDWSVGLHYVDHGFGLLEGRLPGSPARVLFLENDHFFDRWSVYNAEGGRPFADDLERWIFYQRGCLEVCKLLGLRPDVVHTHDSQTGLIPAYLRTTYAQESVFAGTAAVFTVHNLAYQGAYGPEGMQTAGFPDWWFHAGSPFEAYGAMNMMKSGLSFADAITTVSPTYAREIQGPERGHGLEGLLRARSADVSGVLNGIDTAVWNPARDPRIPRHFTREDRTGKRECKRALLARLGLPADDGAPLLGFVGRLVPQKGCDLLTAVLPDVLQHRVRFVALGSGADQYEAALHALEQSHPDQARACIGFDDELAHWIEAGADIFLMPSAYEPCGLNQMYSMAYGTVPVVHATGGLLDTVLEVPPGQEAQGATGFRFHRHEAGDFKEAIYRALVAYADPARWEQLVRNGMGIDFSWKASAAHYLEVYARALARARGHSG